MNYQIINKYYYFAIVNKNISWVSTKTERFIYVDTYIYYMFIETRKQGKKKKYYLVHSYRVGDKVKRISRFLGSDLNQKELERLRKRAEALIHEQIKNINPFELTEDEIKYHKKIDSEIKIIHLQNDEWLRFTEDFVYNTNAIEGSTVPYDESKKLIENKTKPRDSDEQETVNVAKAVNYIKNTKEDFSLIFIKKLHDICFLNTKHFAGKLRDIEVMIKDPFGEVVHRGAPKKEVEKLLEELVLWYKKNKNDYPPLYLASIVHNQFENIHPFQDGNGRVGRLLLNYILIKKGYPPINILLKDRQVYYETLLKFGKNNDIKSTLKFLISQYKKQYKR